MASGKAVTLASHDVQIVTMPRDGGRFSQLMISDKSGAINVIVELTTDSMMKAATAAAPAISPLLGPLMRLLLDENGVDRTGAGWRKLCSAWGAPDLEPLYSEEAVTAAPARAAPGEALFDKSSYQPRAASTSAGMSLDDRIAAPASQPTQPRREGFRRESVHGGLLLKLAAEGGDFNRPTAMGQTPLQLCLVAGDAEAVCYCLQNGADANRPAPDGTFPIMDAASLRAVGAARARTSDLRVIAVCARSLCARNPLIARWIPTASSASVSRRSSKRALIRTRRTRRGSSRC